MESSDATTPPPAQSSTVPGAAGTVNGGQLPVSNALIQLYAVGSTGDGSAATPLLTASVTSDAYGGFSIANKYTCPSPAVLVYLTATGGNPNLASGTNNTGIALMAALGPCGTLNSSTFIQMNELTTVASIFALAPYMTSFDHLGYGPNDIAAFSTAFASVNQLVNNATGTIPGPDLPAGYEVPTAQIDTIADILAGCVDSAGGVSGDTTPCGQLFQYTGGGSTTNTITAALQIANNPTSNTAQLFSLVSSSSPFQPTLNTAPASFTVSATPIASTPSPAPAPTITTAGGSSFPITVSITDSLGGVSIYYTTDGSTPTTSSSLYTSPLSITTNTTVNAIAVAAGYTNSSVTSSLITGTPVAPVPVITTTSESSFPITVTIADSLSGASIHYTTDGSTPTANSPLYAAPFTISVATTINAIAVAPGYTPSPIAGSVVTVLPVVPTPTLAPLAATTFPVTVSISDTLNGTRIYYTTDGTAPTPASTLYTAPFVLSAAATVNAIAVESGYANSQIASTSYGFISPAYSITKVDGCDPNSMNYASCNPSAVAINSVTNTIYIADENISDVTDSNITIIDGNTDTVSGFASTQLVNQGSIAVDSAANKIYVGGYGFVAMSGDTHAVTPVNLVDPSAPSNLIYVNSILLNPLANQIDVLSSGYLFILNSATDSPIATIPTGPYTYAMDIDPTRNHLYVGGNPDFLNIDATAGTIVDAFTATNTYTVLEVSPSIAYNPTNNKVYIATSNVLVYDPVTTTTASINGTGINGTGIPLAIAVNATTNTIYSASNSTLSIINGSTNTITANVPLGIGSPYSGVQLLVDPVLNKIYVLGSYQENLANPQTVQTNLSVLDGSTNVLSTISPNLGQGIGALNLVTHKLYITDIRENLVDIVTPQ